MCISTHGREAAKQPASRPKNPLQHASCFARLFFTWPYPLLKLGMQRPLTDDDLASIVEQDASEYNRDYFLRIWNEEQQRHPERPSLHRAIVKDYLKSTWHVQLIFLVGYTARVVQAVVLGFLVESFSGGNDQGYLWASLIVVCGMIVLMEHHHAFFMTWRKGMQLRLACVAAIYDKSLRLSSTHQDTAASYGQIMNLASNDVERFLMASLFVSQLFWAPAQSLAILGIGIWLLGAAFATGFVMLVCVLVPLQFYLSGKFAYYRSRTAAITDQRVTFVSQAVRGARVMKMSGYEWRFLSRIADYRAAEIEQISSANTLKSWNEALFFCTNVVISLVVFLVHIGLGGTLRPGDVFTVFTLINILQLELTKHVSLGVMGTSECYVSIGRIQRFLQFPELPTQSLGRTEQDTDPESPVIAMSGVRCYWNEVGHDPKSEDESSTDSSGASLGLALERVSIDFRRGQLTAVIGTVGAGKSALLQAIVDELPLSSGTIVRRYKSLAYAAQDPWIMDGSVRENIVMGMNFDREWYNTVVSACGLVLDFEQLRDGDQTIVGDRGVQCSGGQRARIGLARALYRDADVLIADDPLSAVDSKVGRQMFQEAILGLCVKRGKCVILATHQHQYVNECRCVLVSEGRIACIGTYDECVTASNGKLHAHTADDAVDNLVQDEDADSEEEAEVAKVELDDDAQGDDDNKEMNLTGMVKLETYINYLKAMGGIWVGVALFVLFSMTQASVLVTLAFVGKWAQRPASEQDDADIFGIVIGLGAIVILLAIVRGVFAFRLTVRASQRLHDRMAEAVLRAKIEFFDTNPLGRIMNRFSADVGSNDDLLPSTLFDFSVIAFMVVGALITTVISLPFTLVAVPPLLWYFWSVRRIFVTSTRELKRLEGMARSPIFAMLSESLGGIAILRANDCVDYFRRKFRDAHDAHTRAVFAFIGASRWVGFRMDSIIFLFLSMSSFLAVLFSRQGWFDVDPSILGLSISMLLQMAGLFQWCIRQSAEVVNQMVSVERVLAFGGVEPEVALECDHDKAVLAQDWPQAGAIEVKDLSVRYRASLPLALKGVSFSIPAGSRVGVVGRTGSGKSTVVQTLFRLLEAESGSIAIDGVNIAELGLHALRTSISVIPQTPTLFSGCSVRENLDLFGLHSEEELRQVLADCHLASVVDDLPNGWNSLVAENGSNFSVGQRQLLCLARAILSRNRILVLDEATASVDRRTDQLLHEALDKTFANGTILAVAHRLDTVIDCDYILVLGGGEVLEFGAPADLLAQTGPFASMVGDTGATSAAELRQRAMAKKNKNV